MSALQAAAQANPIATIVAHAAHRANGGDPGCFLCEVAGTQEPIMFEQATRLIAGVANVEVFGA